MSQQREEFRMASRICALSPDRQELWRFRLEEGRWLQ
jgi:hypothetical protein